jgi:hypothetical protein
MATAGGGELMDLLQKTHKNVVAQLSLNKDVEVAVNDVRRMGALWMYEIFEKPIRSVIPTARVLVLSHEILTAFVARLGVGFGRSGIGLPLHVDTSADEVKTVAKNVWPKLSDMALVDYYDQLVSNVRVSNCDVLVTRHLEKRGRYVFKEGGAQISFLHMTCWVCLWIAIKFTGKTSCDGCEDFLVDALVCEVPGLPRLEKNDICRLEEVVMHVVGMMTVTHVNSSTGFTGQKIDVSFTPHRSIVHRLEVLIARIFENTEFNYSTIYMVEIAMCRVLNRLKILPLQESDPANIADDAIGYLKALCHNTSSIPSFMSCEEILKMEALRERRWVSLVRTNPSVKVALCCVPCLKKLGVL